MRRYRHSINWAVNSNRRSFEPALSPVQSILALTGWEGELIPHGTLLRGDRGAERMVNGVRGPVLYNTVQLAIVCCWAYGWWGVVLYAPAL